MTSGGKRLHIFVNIGLRLPTKDGEKTHVFPLVLKHL